MYLERMSSRQKPAVFLATLASFERATVQLAHECAFDLRLKAKRRAFACRRVGRFSRDGGNQ